jgi:hypothetical protein
MKRCPKCNRSYTTDTQKFCTQDGGLLVAVDVGQETVLVDTGQLDDDAPTKAISRDLVPKVTGEFDPLKTVMSDPRQTTARPVPGSQGLTTSPPSPQRTSPGSGQISQSEPTTSAPLPTSAPGSSRGTPGISPQSPTMRLTGTGPVPGSAPLSPEQLAQTAQSHQPKTAARPAKKSRWPLVLGIFAVLLALGVVGLGVAYIFVVRPMLAARRVERVEPSPPAKEPTPNIQTSPNDLGSTKAKVAAPEPPPYNPPADAVQFVNSKAHLDGQLAEHYVDFSFYYPNRWQKDPTAGKPGARNFVQVERRLPPDFTQENFAVAWNSSVAPVSENRALFHTLAENLGVQFEKKFPGYRKVSEGETKLGVYDGYEFRFESLSQNTAKGDLKLWGRVVFLPPQDDTKNGVTLLMLATSLAPELKSVNDVGKKGELPMLLESFRFGKR